MDLRQAIITDHAAAQMARREVAEEEVRAVLEQPEHTLDVRAGRMVLQAVSGGFLLRVFVDVDRDPPEIVTVYRTSKIDKYRSGS